MTDACAFPIVAASAVARSHALVSAIEKPNGDKGLRAQVDLLPAGASADDLREARRGSSRSGTTSSASHWNGPRLQAAFVAQVLGQVLAPQARDPGLAFAAYQRDDVRTRQSRLLDRNV
jgi:hypothetical protein